jgi:cobalt-zinc-cadmium efflux system membrane fusion protein
MRRKIDVKLRLSSVVFVVAALAALACGHSPAPTPSGGAPRGEIWLSQDQVRQAQIKIDDVAQRPFTERVVTGGRIAFDDLRVTHVFSPVTGRVSKIAADFGQKVHKGDALAEIESPDLASAYSDEAKAQADLTAAEHDVKRQRDLEAAGAAAQAQLEQSEDAYHKAQAEMERAELKTKLLHARTGGPVSQVYVLRSTLDGEVVGRSVNPGIEVQGMLSGANVANELFTIGSIDKVWLLADLYESQLGRVKSGDTVDITTVSYPDVFRGTVDYVSDVLDPNTRTARLRASIDNADHKLKPEMFVTASVKLGQRQAIAIPRTAVLKLSDQYVVFVEVGRTDAGLLRFAVRPVKLGDDEGGYVEILQGLNPGEQLVTEGAILLSSQA